jgi:hypothetical protein
MPTPDPAERRSVIRGAIECAIALNPTVRPRQAAPLVVSVWRIVEPALAQRDRQITAVRDVIDAMDNTTGARFWAQQLHAALGTRPGAGRPPIAWCGASMPGYGAAPIGPCVLRAGHDGPVHQTADGAKWWPTAAGPVPGVRPLAEIMQLDASTIDPAATHPEPLDGAGIYEELLRIYGGLLPPYTPPPKDACACGGTKTLHAPDCPVHPMRLRAAERQATQALPQELRDAGLHFAYDITPDQCRAEYHQPGYADARCDLAAGHPDYHRDQTAPGGTFRWDDSVAMYPTTTPEDDR